jgi:hypothetical protein
LYKVFIIFAANANLQDGAMVIMEFTACIANIAMI